MMNIFDIPWYQLPNDAEYYYNVLVVNIALRQSKYGKSEIQDCWDLEFITGPRPAAFHIYIEDDSFFDDGENYFIEVCDHCAVEVSKELGISFYDMLDPDEDDEDDDGIDLLFFDPDDFWRFD